jgi:hypothetical protein
MSVFSLRLLPWQMPIFPKRQLRPRDVQRRLFLREFLPKSVLKFIRYTK